MSKQSDTVVPLKPPVTSRGRATLGRLLAAAEAEFGQKGYHAASVAGITNEAGVGQGTWYLYFKSKEDAFRHLVMDIGAGVRRAMAAAVASASDQMDAERRGLEAFVRFVHEHPHLYRIVQESQFVDEALFRGYYRNIAEGYAAALNAAAKRGDLRPGDGETRAWAIMGIGHFLGLRYAVWEGRKAPEAVVDEIMRLLAEGMAPK